MSKILNDKYYTPIELANWCWDKTYEILGSNISEVIEPSCGNGSFYHHPLYIPHFGYDIEPECQYKNVIQGDFLQQDIPYLEGRLIIGNPPYGRCMNMAQKFYKKSTQIADYIAFILPISQLNNQNSLYQFDLIYSYNLGEVNFSNIKLKCCFNIYKRPTSGKLNSLKNIKQNYISIYRQDSKKYAKIKEDIRMCYWGDGTCGKILKNNEHYSAEYKIVINDKIHYDKLYNFITTFDWKNYLDCIAMKKLQQFHIYKAIEENNILT